MSVNAATSVSNFMALYVESQGRTDAALPPAEAAALQVALGQFQCIGFCRARHVETPRVVG